jgi:hypothetical protein
LSVDECYFLLIVPPRTAATRNLTHLGSYETLMPTPEILLRHAVVVVVRPWRIGPFDPAVPDASSSSSSTPATTDRRTAVSTTTMILVNRHVNMHMNMQQFLVGRVLHEDLGPRRANVGCGCVASSPRSLLLLLRVVTTPMTPMTRMRML